MNDLEVSPIADNDKDMVDMILMKMKIIWRRKMIILWLLWMFWIELRFLSYEFHNIVYERLVNHNHYLVLLFQILRKKLLKRDWIPDTTLGNEEKRTHHRRENKIRWISTNNRLRLIIHMPIVCSIMSILSSYLTLKTREDIGEE